MVRRGPRRPGRPGVPRVVGARARRGQRRGSHRPRRRRMSGCVREAVRSPGRLGRGGQLRAGDGRGSALPADLPRGRRARPGFGAGHDRTGLPVQRRHRRRQADRLVRPRALAQRRLLDRQVRLRGADGRGGRARPVPTRRGARRVRGVERGDADPLGPLRRPGRVRHRSGRHRGGPRPVLASTHRRCPDRGDARRPGPPPRAGRSRRRRPFAAARDPAHPGPPGAVQLHADPPAAHRAAGHRAVAFRSAGRGGRRTVDPGRRRGRRPRLERGAPAGHHRPSQPRQTDPPGRRCRDPTHARPRQRAAGPTLPRCPQRVGRHGTKRPDQRP